MKTIKRSSSVIKTVGPEMRNLLNHLNPKENLESEKTTTEFAALSETSKDSEQKKGKKRKNSPPDSPSKRKRRKISEKEMDAGSSPHLPNTPEPSSNDKPCDDDRKSKLEKSKIYEIRNYTITKWTEELIQILKENLARHKWDAAAKILYSLTYEPILTSEVIWKGGYQIFCNHPKSSPNLLMQFAVAVCRLDKIFIPGIILDLIMYFLNNGNYQGAKEALQLKDQFRKKSKPSNAKQEHIFNVLHGYEGMLSFIEWKMSVEEIKDEDDDLDQKKLMEALANKIITMFEQLFTHPGNWDVFLNKYIEIMEYYQRVDQLLQVLKDYALLNPENPNGCRCLYILIQKYRPDDKRTLHSLLRCLSLTDPSNKMLLDIKELNNSDHCEFLKIIFNLIDYPNTKNDSDVWNKLSNLLIELHNHPVKKEFDVLNELWDDRSSWWPEYHFSVNTIEITDSVSGQLHLDKATVFSLLQREGDTYRRTVKKKIKELGFSELLKRMKCIDKFIRNFNKP